MEGGREGQREGEREREVERERVCVCAREGASTHMYTPSVRTKKERFWFGRGILV